MKNHKKDKRNFKKNIRQYNKVGVALLGCDADGNDEINFVNAWDVNASLEVITQENANEYVGNTCIFTFSSEDSLFLDQLGIDNIHVALLKGLRDFFVDDVQMEYGIYENFIMETMETLDESAEYFFNLWGYHLLADFFALEKTELGMDALMTLIWYLAILRQDYTKGSFAFDLKHKIVSFYNDNGEYLNSALLGEYDCICDCA